MSTCLANKSPRPVLADVRARHSTQARIEVDALDGWTIWAIPYGTSEVPRSILVQSPDYTTTVVTPTADTNGLVEAVIGRKVGRFCTFGCAFRWLSDQHGLQTPRADELESRYLQWVAVHGLFSHQTKSLAPSPCLPS